ncbi:hypothetical protein [Candidatus Entotheonella palauensis]|nr:hypothetical protein [Candidatus Entotheonella palauensis]
MSTEHIKADLHRLVEALPAHELQAAQRFLAYLYEQGSDPVLRTLLEAPVDDEPETPEEQAAVQEAREQLARSETIPDADFWKRFEHES